MIQAAALIKIRAFNTATVYFYIACTVDLYMHCSNACTLFRTPHTAVYNFFVLYTTCTVVMYI